MKSKNIGILLALSLCSTSFVKGQTKLIVQDTRSENTSPSSYSTSVESHFKEGGKIGLPPTSSNQYYTLLGLRGWLEDNSGGKAHELAFSNDGRIFFRSGYSPTWEGWRTLLISNEQGFYGIGTPNPTEMLSVNGKIRAKEIKVEAAPGTWPDYVFKKEYKLTSLENTEKHIKKYGFLPGMPSAEEAETNGVDLGSMNKKLLLKLEELTLHTIELQKKVDKLRRQNKAINKRLDSSNRKK